MRTVGTGIDAAGHPCLLLNGQPYFHHGVLDQGYWPDGLYTAPSDDALIYDIELMKRLGFNMLRKHIKVEPMRWYYHCDRLGMLVWQDMPSGGGQYNLLTISAPLITGIHLKDNDHYRLFARTDAQGREDYHTRTDGADHAAARTARASSCGCRSTRAGDSLTRKAQCGCIRRLDPTRLDRPCQRLARSGRERCEKPACVLLSPIASGLTRRAAPSFCRSSAGTICRLPDTPGTTKNFGYKGYQTPEALGEARPERSMKRRSFLHAEQGLAADVYTQLSDVEDEVNGFVTYDRRVEKLPEALMQAIAQELRGD